VTDFLAPLTNLDQDNADANCEARKYGDLDQHLDTTFLPSCEMIGEQVSESQRNKAVNLKRLG
jgi:hypothetical protein